MKKQGTDKKQNENGETVVTVAKADTLDQSQFFKGKTPFDVINWLAYRVTTDDELESMPEQEAQARELIESYGLKSQFDTRVAELEKDETEICKYAGVCVCGHSADEHKESVLSGALSCRFADCDGKECSCGDYADRDDPQNFRDAEPGDEIAHKLEFDDQASGDYAGGSDNSKQEKPFSTPGFAPCSQCKEPFRSFPFKTTRDGSFCSRVCLELFNSSEKASEKVEQGKLKTIQSSAGEMLERARMFWENSPTWSLVPDAMRDFALVELGRYIVGDPKFQAELKNCDVSESAGKMQIGGESSHVCEFYRVGDLTVAFEKVFVKILNEAIAQARESGSPRVFYIHGDGWLDYDEKLPLGASLIAEIYGHSESMSSTVARQPEQLTARSRAAGETPVDPVKFIRDGFVARRDECLKRARTIREQFIDGNFYAGERGFDIMNARINLANEQVAAFDRSLEVIDELIAENRRAQVWAAYQLKTSGGRKLAQLARFIR